jgi:plastocyanin
MIRFLAAPLAVLWAVSASAEGYTVLQKDKLFSRDTIQVRAGDSITFSNQDTVTHNVFSVSPGNTFEIKTQLPGKSSTVSFENPGTAEVRCAIHPTMKLTVNVQP